jgi:glyoxylate reductase
MSKIVVTGRIPEVAVEKLQAEHEVDAWSVDESMSRDELLSRVVGADALVTLLTERVDAELLDAAGPQLRVVANVAVGYDNIDVPACVERGVVATNTPAVLTEATADIAMMLILMATRRAGEGERVIRSGQPWKWGMFYLLGTGLQGKTLGVVGMGAIGVATARRARAFGMNVIYQSLFELSSEVAAELGARRVLELDELLATADVVSLHCWYSPETHHLIGAAQFAAMRETAYLVNTARGPIVDEAALVDALGTVRSPAPAWTSMSVSRWWSPDCWSWTTSRCCRTWARQPSRPVRRWQPWRQGLHWRCSVVSIRRHPSSRSSRFGRDVFPTWNQMRGRSAEN